MTICAQSLCHDSSFLCSKIFDFRKEKWGKMHDHLHLVIDLCFFIKNVLKRRFRKISISEKYFVGSHQWELYSR